MTRLDDIAWLVFLVILGGSAIAQLVLSGLSVVD
jgi:hypothetical protein